MIIVVVVVVVVVGIIIIIIIIIIILIGKFKGKRLLGRSRHRWEDNIRMDLTEIE
jgi:hypothetical protein